MSRILVTLIALAALAAGCGGDDDGGGGGNDGGSASGAAAGQAAETNGEGGAEKGDSGGSAAEGESGGSAAEGESGGRQSGGDAAAMARRGSRLTLRDSQFGPVLFDGRNRALYLFTRDARHKTRCYGGCAAAWPPFYAKGRPRAGRGVDGSLVGTIKRRDGRRQVTYKGQPLYFYVDDPRGQVLCNDVAEFGGTWYAVDANGNAPA